MHGHRPKALLDLLADVRVKEIDDERSHGNGYFVYLSPGWVYGHGGAHCFSEDTLRDVRQTLGRVIACSCEDCQKGKGW